MSDLLKLICIYGVALMLAAIGVSHLLGGHRKEKRVLVSQEDLLEGWGKDEDTRL